MAYKAQRNPIVHHGGRPGRFTMLPFDLNRLTADDGMTVIARAVMTVLWSHKDGHATSAVEMAKQLGCERHFVAQGLTTLVDLRWLVVQEVRYSDNPNRVVYRRYHLAMDRVFTADETGELSHPILLARKHDSLATREHLASTSLAGDPGSDTTSPPGSERTSPPGSAATTSLDEGLDQKLDAGAARPARARARARTLIRDNIPDAGRYLSSELGLLTTVTAGLLADPACCKQAVGLALQEWDRRDDLGPRALAGLVSDVLNTWPQLRQSPSGPEVQVMQGERP